jgi:hypothetical protein
MLPVCISVLVLAASIYRDLIAPGTHWTQRAGSIVTVTGAYVALVGTKRSFKVIEDSMFMNFSLPYVIIAIALTAIGTLIWGYGDLLLWHCRLTTRSSRP